MEKDYFSKFNKEENVDRMFGGNERAEEQNKDRLKGGYGGDYYDENEHRAGQEKYDLATGKSYRNDLDVENPQVRIVENEDFKVDDLKDLEDETEKYLLANDPTYLGKGKWKEDKEAA